VNEIVKEEDKQKKMCPVCFDNEVNTALVPCGHTYCSYCINKTNNCYICRGNIRNKIKLFL
jgi:hypothetical protein